MAVDGGLAVAGVEQPGDDPQERGLARAVVADERGLRAVPGVGPAKLEQYGEELLALLGAD